MVVVGLVFQQQEHVKIWINKVVYWESFSSRRLLISKLHCYSTYTCPNWILARLVWKCVMS